MQTNAHGYQRGDKVAFHTREGLQLLGTYSHHCPNGKAYIKGDDGVSYERTYNKIAKTANASTNFSVSSNSNNAQIKPKSDWDINQRFEFLQQLVRMVMKKDAVSMIVTGEGGLGKTYTVKREIIRRQLVKDQDYVYIKGFSTPRGLYRALWENKDKLVIFDDCDEILLNDIAKNLLKGALDSYDEREIHWITKTSDESLPDSFEFKGQVIFISNRSQDSIDQALLSRSMCVDLTMSREDKLKRMRFIVDNSKEFMPQVSKEDKEEAFQVIEENLEDCKEVSLRTLEKVLNLKVSARDDFQYDDTDGMVNNDWKLLAKYMLIN